MSAGRVLYLVNLLLLCVWGDLTTGVVNVGLDPDRVTWWRGKWAAAPVVLSSNNKGAAGVTVSLYFTPSTTVAGKAFTLTLSGSDFVCSPTGGTSISVGRIYGRLLASV